MNQIKLLMILFDGVSELWKFVFLLPLYDIKFLLLKFRLFLENFYDQ